MKVIFGNQGLIDPRMWSTFGVSVKDSTNPIGQFGTGLKYAIAVLLRNKRQISITSGPNKFEFSTKPMELRGKEFEQIYCNDEPLPFTTHLGSGWELWQAYRELCSNAIDEGGGHDIKGETTITAELGDIVHSDVFLSPRPTLISSNTCQVLKGESRFIYLKGVRVHSLQTPSKFTYNLLCGDLTEDRTLKFTWQLNSTVGHSLASCEDKDVVFDLVTQTKGYFEEQIPEYAFGEVVSEEILELVSRIQRDGKYILPGLLAKALALKGNSEIETTEPDWRQRAIIDKAKEFCRKIGYEVKFPILYAPNIGTSTLALADTKRQIILLSERLLSQGTKQVVSALIEENIHLEKGLSDCTYELQSYLFDQIVSLSERIVGEVL